MNSTLVGRVKRGYGVASGAAGDARFPQGTIRCQIPHFRRFGLDLDGCFPATINVDISPYRFELIAPDFRFEQLRWSPAVPAETFSFCACDVEFAGSTRAGWVYYPHPETKPEHFHDASTVELLAPKLKGLRYGDRLTVCVAAARIRLLE